MTTRLKLLIGVLLVLIGYAFGYYTLPEKVVTKTVTDVKTVTVTQHDVETVVVNKPDGTTETKIIDHSTDTTKSEDTSVSTKTIENGKPNWKVSVQGSTKHPELQYFYGAQVERRILGPIFVGAFGNVDKTVGLTVGLEF